MITEDYVSFETAKLLKEKGFNEYCRAFRSPSSRGTKGLFYSVREVKNIEKKKTLGAAVVCPTIQMAMKWLREVHNLHISVEMGFDVDNSQYFFFVPSVCKFSNKGGEYFTPFGEKEFNTHEEACEVAIKYCLEKLI